MATTFLGAGGNQAPSGTSQTSRNKIVTIDPMYQILISNGSDENPIKFHGYVPESFSIGLSSGWSAPFQGMTLMDVAQSVTSNLSNTGGMIGKAAQMVNGVAGNTASALSKFAGVNAYAKILSAQIWDAPGYLTLELPIFLDAYSDTKTEVVNRIYRSLCMAAPSEKAGLLLPPGPTPMAEAASAILGAASSYNTGGSSTGSDSASSNSGILDKFDSKEAFTVSIGNFFYMFPAIIENVSMTTENVFESGTGKPLSADIMISVKSYFAVTRADLKEWFGADDSADPASSSTGNA